MTHANLPPEDAFDRWLDDLVRDGRSPDDNDVRTNASWLHRHFGLAPVKTPRLTSNHKAALRQRIMPQPVSPPGPARSPGSAGLIATPLPLTSKRGWWTGRRILSLISAAILLLIGLASVSLVLRLDDTEQMPGVSATASLMPFAPSAVLASATPVPTCVTSDALVLMPQSRPDAAAFTNLSFPVAWYDRGTLTVEQGGEVLRQIEVGPAERLQPTTWPDVVLVSNDAGDQHASLANIRTGEVAPLGPVFDRQWTNGAYLLWASDASHFTWHIIDLRTFARVDLNEHFRIEPAQGWRPSVPTGNSSDDGAVILIDTPLAPSAEPISPTATPVAPDLPTLEIGATAILVDGDLDHTSLVGPISRSSGDTALSPDGEFMAWLAPSEVNPHEERVLTIAETDTGEVIGQRPVEATYSNSLLFSRDASILYSASGTLLDQFVFATDMSTPVAASRSIRLPEPGYSIAAASPDRSKLILSVGKYAHGPALYWVDLDTGTLRQIDGVIGRMWQSTFPVTVAPRIGRFFLVEDLTQEVSIIDMTTGETIMKVDRNDGAATITISRDDTTVMIPTGDGIDIIDLATRATMNHAAPAGVEAFAQPASISSDGACTAASWRLAGGDTTSVLLPTTGDTRAPLPASTSGGWVDTADS